MKCGWSAGFRRKRWTRCRAKGHQRDRAARPDLGQFDRRHAQRPARRARSAYPRRGSGRAVAIRSAIADLPDDAIGVGSFGLASTGWTGDPHDIPQRQDAVRIRRQPRHRARDRAARRARRRQCRDCGEDRGAAPETQGHHLHRRRRDSRRRRQGVAGAVRHPRRGAGDRGNRPDRRRVRRHRYLRQQRQRHQPDQFADDRHEAVRPDDGHQHPRHLHGVEILHSASEEGGKSAHPDAVAAARHEAEMVRAFHRLHHGEVRHEHVRARAVGRTEIRGRRGQRAVAAHHHRHRRGRQSARRRRHDARQPHARDHGRCRPCHFDKAFARIHRAVLHRRQGALRQRRQGFRALPCRSFRRR